MAPAAAKGNFYTDVILVDRSVAPTVSPAPAPGRPGNLNGCVPQGYVKQIGNDAEADTMTHTARR
jgi:hypothetical protein